MNARWNQSWGLTGSCFDNNDIFKIKMCQLVIIVKAAYLLTCVVTLAQTVK